MKKKLVITGPESTGKSMLGLFLHNATNFPLVPEYAVEYLKNLNRKYLYEDLVKIAKEQVKSETKAGNANAGLLICDTDLITIKIWSEVRFGKVDDWILKTLLSRHYDHYLLCYPDIDWEFAEFRENPYDRDVLFNIYEKELLFYKKPYTIIKGTYDQREKTGLKILYDLIK